MLDPLSRRGFLGLAPALSFAFPSPQSSQAAAPASFPQQDDDAVREVVTVAHGNLARVKELVTARPALARVSWDWGYGDWETPIDAASHVGNRPIAEFLIANGARPTVFTAVMMGHLALVRGFVEASPGIQRTRGPHGLTFVAHARVGGAAAADVLKYLESLGDADPRYTNVPLTDEEQAGIAGEYTFGPGASDRLKIVKGERGFTIERPGHAARGLAHQGRLVFNPVGAEAVHIEIRLAPEKSLTVRDGALVVVARAI
jgi:hypothetical protein